MKRCLMLLLFASMSGPATAQDAAPEAGTADSNTEAAAASEETGGVKTMSGMSILGNEEAPKSLVIVPWKSSQIGDGLGGPDALDEAARPVDKEVFMREVHYYELRSEGEGSHQNSGDSG